jgi:hypothetical protein
MSEPFVVMSGFITRSNLATPLPDLPIFVDPYWPIMGDDADAADMSMQSGIMPGQSATKYVWADSPYVAGQQLVLATPDISTLDLRLVIDGDSMLDAQNKIAPIIQAVRNQLSFTVSVTFDEATYAWNCWNGDYLVAINQLWMFGYLVPMYLTLPRDPTPVSGPV